jgi:1-aminocyclopropane-1-carboxylate deaminase
MINFPIETQEVDIQALTDELLERKNLSVDVLRLDKVHPVVSGNKLYKLYYYLEEAVAGNKRIITFGGAYSNHLAATAKACNELKIASVGMVRGEEPPTLSHTLQFCKDNNMDLVWLGRTKYTELKNEEVIPEFEKQYGPHLLIPEGGYAKKGREGASFISSYYNRDDYTHICCAVGTATTMAGLLKTANNKQQTTNFLGFSALKGLNDLPQRMQYLLGKEAIECKLINDYHFGGYAKKTAELISFMNIFYLKHHIPTDFVYTGKMFFGVWDMISKEYFSPGSKLLCIHTGGLQGNLSLPQGSLIF